MLNELSQLAANPDAESRRELLRGIADMFYASDRNHLAEREVQLFADVVARVLKDMTEGDRAAFSTSVADSERTPRAVALTLANDTAAVAAPVIQKSPALSDDDLISIANTRGTGHRLAISQRPNVGERVTDVLVDFGETEVMMSLLDNPTARTSTQSLDRIADMAENVAALREKLCFRQGTPESVLRRILPLLAEPARAKATTILNGSADGLQELARQAATSLALERGEAARRRLDIKAKAKRVDAGQMPIDAFIDELTTSGRPLDLALALSEIAAMGEREVANAVISTKAEPLAMLCKVLHVGVAAYGRAEAMRRESVKLSAVVPQQSLDQYEALDIASAERALRFVKVRGAALGG